MRTRPDPSPSYERPRSPMLPRVIATLRFGPHAIDQCIGIDEQDVYERLGRRAARELPLFPERVPEDRRAAVLSALEEGRFADAARLHYLANPAIEFALYLVEIPDIDPFALEDLAHALDDAGNPPRLLTVDERAYLAEDADRLAEGALRREDLAELPDGSLLRAWTGAMRSYVLCNLP